MCKKKLQVSEQKVALDPKTPRTQLSRLHGASKGQGRGGGGGKVGRGTKLVIAGISDREVVCAGKIEAGKV